jgi:hypothetical protein
VNQNAVTILSPVVPGSDLEALRSALEKLGKELDLRTNTELEQLVEANSIHFFSFFLIESLPQVGPAYVALEVNCDGSRRHCHQLLARVVPRFLRALFGHCTGFPRDADRRQLASYLAKHDQGADAFYVGCPGRSVPQIRIEARLRQTARALFDAAPDALSAFDAWSALRRGLTHYADLDATVESATERPFWVRFGLNPKGARSQLKSAVRTLLATVAWTAGAFGFALTVGANGVFSPASVALSLTPPVLAATLVLTLWWLEAPARPSARTRLLFLGGIVRAWLSWSFAIAVTIGLLALLPWLLPLSPVALSLFIGAVGIGFWLLGSAFVYLAAGGLPAVLFGLLALPSWLGLVALNLFTPVPLAAIGAGAALAFFVPAALASAAFSIAIRRAEMNDEDGTLDWDLEHLEQVTKREDRQLQNHLATVALLKPGLLRLYALRVVLRTVSIGAKLYFNHGDLAGITSIHFGRFLISPDRTRLLFLGNYDGGFGAYLSAFHAVPGVTAVWSNTLGFPRSFFLVGEGARDEQRFKAFARRSQIPTLGWYSAYPDVSVQAIDAGTTTREDLKRETPSHEHGDRVGLLARLRRAAKAALDEAACDAALRRL